MGIISQPNTPPVVTAPVSTPVERDSARQYPVVRIQPSRGWVDLQLPDLWQYRELLFFMIWRDLKVKYKQTILGASWAILQPIITMVVFTVVFGRIARIATGTDIPYPIFSYSALVAWSFFAGALGGSANSLVGNSRLIKKIYFPRLVIPIALSAGSFVEFALSFVVLIVLMLVFGFVPTINVIFLPIFLLIAYITALGVGLWLSALNVHFRDVRFAVPFLIQTWLFLTPVIYPITAIENPTVRAIYNLNPMSGVVEGFRWALLGEYAPPEIGALVASTIGAVVVLITGVFIFRRMEKTFADVV